MCYLECNTAFFDRWATMFWRNLMPPSNNIKLLALWGKTWFCFFLQNTANYLSQCPIVNQSAVFTDTRTSNLTTRKQIFSESKVVLLHAMKCMGRGKGTAPCILNPGTRWQSAVFPGNFTPKPLIATQQKPVYALEPI